MSDTFTGRTVSDVYPSYGNWGNNGDGLAVGWNVLNDGVAHPTCFSAYITTLGSVTPSTDGAKVDGFLTVTGATTLKTTLSGALLATAGLVSSVAAVAVPIDVDDRTAIEGVLSGKYLAATPAIQSISQSADRISGGVIATIQGTGLKTATSVRFGTVNATWFSATDTQIRCLVPQSTAGAVDVVVTVAAAPGGSASVATLASGFTYSSATIATTQTNYLASNTPAAQQITNIALGPDGNLWFADGNSSGLGVLWQMTPGGTGTQIPGSGFPSGYPGISHTQSGVLIGSDGNIWTYDHHGGLYRVQRFEDGQYIVTPYLLYGEVAVAPDAQTAVVAPDGSNWFIGGTDPSSPPCTGWIWRVTTSGKQTVAQYAGVSFYTASIGLDGNIWCTGANDSGILVLYSFNPATMAVVTGPTSLSPLTFARRQCTDAAGNFWITATDSSTGRFVAKITPAGVLTTFTVSCQATYGICFGPDGNIWAVGANFTSDSVVFKMNTSGSILATHTLTSSLGTQTPAHPGFATDICTASGALYVCVGRDTTGSQKGYVVKIT